MPLGRAVLPPAEADGEDGGPPMAIVCQIQGRDARRCPACGREFLMKPSFLGKLIRCRGCKAPFRVAGPVQEIGERPALNHRQPAAAKVATQRQFNFPPRPVPFPPKPLPTVFDDIGDLVDELLPHEKVASVVRPRPVVAAIRPANDSVASVLALVGGGVCALPITQLILWWVFNQDPLGVAKILPEFLRWLAPAQFWS